MQKVNLKSSLNMILDDMVKRLVSGELAKLN